MARFASLFVILCMAVVAISLGVVFRLQAGFSLADSLLVTLAFLAVFLGIHLHSVRRRDYDEMMDRADEVERQNDLSLEDLRNLEKRLSALEANAHLRAHIPDIEPVITEVEVLGTLIKQVAETMAEFEIRLAENERRDDSGGPARAQPQAEQSSDGPDRPDPASGTFNGVPRSRPMNANAPRDPAGLETDPDPQAGDPRIIRKIREAVEAGKIDLYLQPIVTLPQRKTRYYEALTRLQLQDGALLMPSEFLPVAEKTGILPMLDNLMLLKSVQIVRRLSARNKETGIFCNLSPASLADNNFFSEFIEFMENNRALSSHLVFEFSQKTVRGMGPVEFESLQALVDLGYRLSIDQISDLRMDLGNLAGRGFKFAKIAADKLVSKPMDLGTEIHVEDLSSLLARNGIELIVDHIETEAQVLDLLDFDIGYAQGYLFSPPRPVRADVYQGFASETEPKRLATG